MKESSNGVEHYPAEGPGAMARLSQVVMAEIEAEGAISFSEFFEVALYHPQDGYYARMDRARTGREGDFFTAVSVGPLFGRILAEYAAQLWARLGRPGRFRVVEWGGEQGDLAKDIAAGATDIGGAFAAAFQYAVVEPIDQKREQLRKILPSVEVVASAGDLVPVAGLVIANELIDALAFWLICWEEGQWWERKVVATEEGFSLKSFPPAPDLQKRLQLLKPFEKSLATGYQSEIRSSLAPLLAEMKSVLDQGEIVLLDYGYERQDYYHPARTTGTIRTYGKHEAGEDPLVKIGELDITAHVDFTSLMEDGESVGLPAPELQNQGSFLTKAAASWLRLQDGQVDPSMIRQFQTLTHPAHLGTKFWVVTMKVET